jgi:NADH-quinone oxidoreductase subunit J
MLDFLFYSFSSLLIISAILVIALRNPAHSVLSLIFAFFNAAGLFILLGAEYIALTLVIVYVGAVAVLFLFVVMMLNINITSLKREMLKLLPLGIGITVLFIYEIYILTIKDFGEGNKIGGTESSVTNTKMLGKVIYTDYFFVFQSAGIVLLVAMIGAIVLTLTHSKNVKRQDPLRQVTRSRADTVKLVKVESRKGVKI